VTEIACHHNKVLATWHADTDEWTYQHRVARKRPTQKQSEQLAKMFDQAGSATGDGGFAEVIFSSTAYHGLQPVAKFACGRFAGLVSPRRAFC
jgi:hypothetical protein